MAYTQAQLDALESALVNGTLSVEFEGKRVTYRSLAEIERAMSVVKKGLGLGAVAQRFSLGRTSKG